MAPVGPSRKRNSKAPKRPAARRPARPDARIAHLAALKAAFDAAPFGVWVRDRGGRTILQNRRLRTHWGDQMGKRPEDSGAAPKVVAAWKAANRRAFRGQTVRQEVEYATRHRTLWFYNIVTPLRVGRRIEGIIGFLIDISDRKRAEDALRDSEATLRAITDTAVDAIFVKDAARRYTFLNPTAVRFLGRPLNALLGKTPEELFGSGDACVVRETDDSTFAGQRFDAERPLHLPQGTRVLHTIQSPVRDPDGRIRSICGIVRDVTRRAEAERALLASEAELERRVADRTERLRESEARFRSLFEAMAEGVIVTAPDGRILQANAAAERILGLQRADIEGRSYTAPDWNVSRPDGTPMPPGEMAGPRAMAAGRPVRDVVMGVRRGDGTTVWLNVSAAPLKDVQGRTEGIVGTFTDITDRRRAEDQARRRAAQLAQLASELTVSEYRERYRLAGLLHDHLQQLIVGARMQAHYLGTGKGKVDPSAIDTLLHTLDEALNSARSITTDLVPAVPLRRDLPMALEWLARDMRERHRLAVSIRVDRIPTTMSEATGVLLYSAARELLVNVVKHARTRRAELRLLRLRGGWVALEVSDRGKGFDVASLQQNGDHRRFGLFSISERADLLGGSLVLGRAGRRGTRALLTLPVSAGRRAPRREG